MGPYPGSGVLLQVAGNLEGEGEGKAWTFSGALSISEEKDKTVTIAHEALCLLVPANLSSSTFSYVPIFPFLSSHTSLSDLNKFGHPQLYRHLEPGSFHLLV